MKPQPFPIAATLCTLIGVLILCGLGTWQMKRLELKSALLESIEQEYAKDPTEHPLTIADIRSVTKETIRRGTISGTFQKDHIIPVHNGKQGYDHYVPIFLNEGGEVLVSIQESQIGIGVITLAGIVRYQGTPWRFGIKNNPKQNEWVYLDLDDVRSHLGRPALPQTVFYVEDDGEISERYSPRNKHKQYAIFWFTMCGILLLTYYARFWRKEDK